MARYLGPRGQLIRRERQTDDMALFSGVTPIDTKVKIAVLPGQHGARGGKLSGYGKQFRAKQLLKRSYQILERQFRNYFRKAAKVNGPTGEVLLRFLESRLDNVVYRLGFARTRKEARQLVSHGGIVISNDKGIRSVNIPSYQVEVGDEIYIREKCRGQGRIQEAMELGKQRGVPEWLEVDASKFRGVVKDIPDRNEVLLEIAQLVVELYSK